MPAHPRPFLGFSALLLLLAALTGCENNIGRAFAPAPGGGGGGTTEDQTNVQALEVGGTIRDGRPSVVEAFPTGGGWPSTVPILVLFDEAVNEESVAPSDPAAGDPTVFVRAEGTERALPATYDFLLGGRAVLIRPSAPLLPGGGGPGGGGGGVASFEVVVDPEVRDVDGVRFGGDEEVVATFTADQDPSFEDGTIVATLPLDNARGELRETPIYAIFDRPATISSVTTSNFVVQTSAAAPVAGTLSFPLEDTASAASDGRVLRFDSTAALPGGTDLQIVVDETITFGPGQLDFSGRTPFAEFETQNVEQPLSVTVGNPTTGFPDKVNRSNLETLTVDVALPASALAGDAVLVRIYGLDPETDAEGDVNFVERPATVPVSGAQTVTVDFSAALGSVTAPRFEDGSATFVARASRGGEETGFIRGSSTNEAGIDATQPTLLSVGPPNANDGDDGITDLVSLSLFGVASEELGAASLTIGASTASLYAGDSSGQFLMRPILLGTVTSTQNATLTITDAAGNDAATTFPVDVDQRGLVTGDVGTSGSLTVEVYDSATLATLSGVTVLIEPGASTLPGTGQLTMMTGTDGRAVFPGLGSGSYSITLVLDGYHLFTLRGSPGDFVSLPLRPQVGATATLSGVAAFAPIPSNTAVVGVNVLDDVQSVDVQTTTSDPTTIPATAIRPNRPIVLTALSGLIDDPLGGGSLINYACFLCGATGADRRPPLLGASPAGAVLANLTLLPAAGTAVPLAADFSLDFASAAGLGTIDGTPSVRVVGSLLGLHGMSLFGTGLATSTGATSYTIGATYSVGAFNVLTAFSPLLYVSTEARDAAGNISRHRRLIANPNLGTTFPTASPPGIPTITAPGGPFTGPPAVEFQDRLDASTVIAGFGYRSVTATDPGGRCWEIFAEDTDGAVGAVTWQFPDLSALTSVTGLADGSWSIEAEDFVLVSAVFSAGDYVLEERLRQMVSYARAAPVSFTIQ